MVRHVELAWLQLVIRVVDCLSLLSYCLPTSRCVYLYVCKIIEIVVSCWLLDLGGLIPPRPGDNPPSSTSQGWLVSPLGLSSSLCPCRSSPHSVLHVRNGTFCNFFLPGTETVCHCHICCVGFMTHLFIPLVFCICILNPHPNSVSPM